MSESRKREKKSAIFKTTKVSEQPPKMKRRESRKSPKSAIRSFVFSPIFNVVALVILLVAVHGGMRLFSANRKPAQIAFVERAAFDQPETINADDRSYPAPEIFRGEVYDTTVRLRETGALGMAMSLAVFAEFSEKKNIPANLETVLNSIQTRGLMPPEMTFQNDELSSPSSSFIIRYRSQPLAFEIFSRPKQDAGQSPALLLRFPITSLDKRTITYFQSSRANRFELPEAFASLERIVGAGWTLEQWRGDILPKAPNAIRLLADEKRLLNELSKK